MLSLDMGKRHPSVQDAMRWLKPNPQLPSHMLAISQHFYDLAEELLRDIDVDSPQLTLALHKLVEAKDCAVRARKHAYDAPRGAQPSEQERAATILRHSGA